MIARKSNMLLNTCNLSQGCDQPADLPYVHDQRYLYGESGENHVISKRVMGNKDIEIETRFSMKRKGRPGGPGAAQRFRRQELRQGP